MPIHLERTQPHCNLVWGATAAARAAEEGDVIVVVDTLSFSTTTAVAVASGAWIYPCATVEEATETARRVGAEKAVKRSEVPELGQYSLSPMTYMIVKPGTRIVVRSVNGGVCALAARIAPAVFAGALLNARAVAAAVGDVLHHDTKRGLTVVACGERDAGAGDMPIRFAVEDLLGAGAIIVGANCYKSPSARAAEAAFEHLREDLAWALCESASGKELIAQGFGADVSYASELDLYESVPLLREDHFELPAPVNRREVL